MKKQKWSILKPGDCVDIVAPAGKPKSHTLRGIESFLKTWGLQARIHKDLLGQDLLCSNTKEQRVKILKAAFEAKDSQMIWCLRGGYGSFQLLDDLSKMKPQSNKAFVGFSDITSLHTFLIQEWGWSTIHGPHIDRFALGTGTQAEAKRLHRLLFGLDDALSFDLKPMNTAARVHKTLKAATVGGNLITLQASFGTSYQLKTQGQFVFIEEIGERAYKIDRVFEHMRQLGLLKNIKALLLGQFTEGQEPNGRNLVPTYLKAWAEQQKFPVLTGLPCGHGKNQKPLPLGTRSLLQLGKMPKLTLDGGAKDLV